MLTIPPNELSSFQAADREQCGVLIEGKNGIYIVEVQNTEECPESYAMYLSDVELVADNLRRGEKVIGFFHTHLPNHPAFPSDSDYDGAELFPKMQNCVYKPATGELNWYGSSLAEVDK